VDCDGLKYIGSTKQTLKSRLRQHKYRKKYSSRELNLDDCKIYTLEECDEEQRKEREQYWINHTECVNERNTLFDKKKHYRQNRDKVLKNQKEYRDENRDKIIEYQRNYYHYQNSWAGDSRYYNNLLKIDLNIFL